MKINLLRWLGVNVANIVVMALVKVDFNEEFKTLKEFYSCAKCKSGKIQIPVLLMTCRHIFCTKCLLIKGKQKCPQCGIIYRCKDIHRGNNLITSIHKIINNIENAFPQTNDESNRFSLEFDPIQCLGIINKLTCIGNRSGNASETVSTDSLAISKKVTTKQENTDVEMNASTSARDINEVKNNLLVQGILNEPNEKVILQVEDEFKHVQICKAPLVRNEKGESLLHLAIKRANIDYCQELIQLGIDINCVDWANWTPLHEAVQCRSIDGINLLLEAGCLVNVPAENYITPLHEAVELRDQTIINLLCKHGADPLANDINGSTPKDKWTFGTIHKVVDSNGPHGNLVYNTNLSKCVPKTGTGNTSQLLKYITAPEEMEHLSVDGNLFQPMVLAALLRAVPIIMSEDVPRFLKCTNLAFVQLIPAEIRDAYRRSLRNRLHRLPKLLDGFMIHIPVNVSYRYRDVTFKGDTIRELIEIAGGSILRRVPRESMLESVRIMPYHAKHCESLKQCGYYIIYDHNNPPTLMYNMKELRHMSAKWLFNCIWNHEIKWP